MVGCAGANSAVRQGLRKAFVGDTLPSDLQASGPVAMRSDPLVRGLARRPLETENAALRDY